MGEKSNTNQLVLTLNLVGILVLKNFQFYDEFLGSRSALKGTVIILE